MFIRPCYRKKNGKRHPYCALVESYRTERGPRQRTVAYLGQLDERVRLGVKEAAQEGRGSGQKKLFEQTEAEWVEVDTSRVRAERCRDFGGPWVGLELARKLGLNEFLDRTIPAGREAIPWRVMVPALVIARLCNPSGELRIRPIWHQKAERVQAHILVCFLAYVLWKMLSHLCWRAGLGSQPRRVFEQLSKIKVVDVVVPTRTGIEIRRRCITQPTDHQAILLQRPGLRLPVRIKMTEM